MYSHVRRLLPGFKEHPNYDAWREFVHAMSLQHGVPGFEVGSRDLATRYHIKQYLIPAGADPEQIKAAFTLLFLT